MFKEFLKYVFYRGKGCDVLDINDRVGDRGLALVAWAGGGSELLCASPSWLLNWSEHPITSQNFSQSGSL